MGNHSDTVLSPQWGLLIGDTTGDGTVNAGSHNIDLTTTGSGHDIAIDAKLEGKTINLVSAAKDTQKDTAKT